MQNTPTPGRRIGLSRISPRGTKTTTATTTSTTATPPSKRPITAVNNEQQKQSNQTPVSSAKRSIVNRSKIEEDCDSFATPTKKLKSLGRFVFTPKQTNDPASETCTAVKTADDLKADIAQMKAHLEKYEKYKREKKDLECLIEKWSEGGKQAVRQLQDEIKPQQDIEQILKHLNIPTEIFGNITDDE